LIRFIEAALKVEVRKDDLDRVHRMGAKRSGFNRPVVTKFQRSRKSEVVRKTAPAFKGKKFGISERSKKDRRQTKKVVSSDETGQTGWKANTAITSLT